MTLLSGLTALMVTFPLFLPTWEQRPIQPSDLDFGPRPVKMPTENIEWQAREGFKWADEAALRCRFIRELGKTAHPKATQLLLRQLNKEKEDPEVQATILRQLQNLPLNDLPAADWQIVNAYLLDRHRAVRREAVRLYALYDKCQPADLLKTLDKYEDSVTTRAVLTSVLQLDVDEPVSFKTLEKWRQSPEIDISTLAWTISCRAKDVEAHETPLETAGKNAELPVRFALAQEVDQLPEPLSSKMTALLSKDPDPACRARVANSIKNLQGPQYLQPLIRLAKDPDYSVRIAALASLATRPREETATEVAAAILDKSRLVRLQAESSAVTIFQQYEPIADMVAAHLAAAKSVVRYHAYRTLGRMKAYEFRRVVTDALRQETRPDNLAAGLYAVYKLKATGAASLILEHGDHADAKVRAAAVKAAGILKPDQAHDFVVGRLKDEDPDVRYEAIVALGRNRDPQSPPELLMVLQSTSIDSIFGETHRAAACWAAAQLANVPETLLARLQKQATTMVIKTPMGPIYEGKLVLGSVALALGEIAQRQSNAKPFANTVLTRLGSTPGEDGLFETDFVADPTTREMARQAKALMEGRELNRVPRPTKKVPLSYKKID